MDAASQALFAAYCDIGEVSRLCLLQHSMPALFYSLTIPWFAACRRDMKSSPDWTMPGWAFLAVLTFHSAHVNAAAQSYPPS